MAFRNNKKVESEDSLRKGGASIANFICRWQLARQIGA